MRTLKHLLFALAALAPPAAHAADYEFEAGISRTVLENYLARSITMLDLLTGHGNVEDNVRMLRNTGAKFAGRTIYLWGHEGRLPERLAAARRIEPRIHAADPEMILQACVFEIVSEDVEKIAVPAWAFEAFGLVPEKRNFRYAEMLYPSGRGHDHWRPGSSIPDVSRPETRLWFYFLAVSYIDAGCEAIHFGQAEIMDGNDPDHRHWQELLDRVRAYAARHARRRWVLCDAHVPSGGMRQGERLLFDFHSFPLRIVEVPDRPQEGILKMGAFDSIYGRSMGGIAPSGWQCEHLPYLVELDNWGASPRPGQPHAGGCWVWGYDEISWFAHQDEAYRNQWLRYAWRWVREHDPNGFFQMPGSRILHSPVDGRHWYYANTRSEAVPQGFSQEETIKAIWSGEDLPKEGSVVLRRAFVSRKGKVEEMPFEEREERASAEKTTASISQIEPGFEESRQRVERRFCVRPDGFQRKLRSLHRRQGEHLQNVGGKHALLALDDLDFRLEALGEPGNGA